MPKISTLTSVIYWDAVDSDDLPLYCAVAGFSSDDTAYIGRIDKTRRRDLAEGQLESALSAIPDEDIYPIITDRGFRKAQDSMDTFVKRPSLHDYFFYRGNDGSSLYQLRDLILDEAIALEIISKKAHPNIVRYHGCRIKEDRLSGIVLEKLAGHSLSSLQKPQLRSIDMGSFMQALESAVETIHQCGLSHNDICPQNVIVRDGKPVLIDFGSCRKTGDRMAASGGSTGWKEDGDDYLYSKESHDLSGLAKIRQWIQDSTSGICWSLSFPHEQ